MLDLLKYLENLEELNLNNQDLGDFFLKKFSNKLGNPNKKYYNNKLKKLFFNYL